MTRITGGGVHGEENKGSISFSVAGVEKLNISTGGNVKWGTAAAAASGAAGAFTAAAGTAALSASRWDGGSGTTYAIADIVAALKAANILGA
jgi:hypothetical protein